jgi:peptide/nickel transport system substrate-binding protein
MLPACATPAPLPTLAPTLAAETPAASAATATPPATLTATAMPSPTPIPTELIVCQTTEPLSLYLYRDEEASRAGIFEALYDGPIDTAGYELQPVILQKLPSLTDGDAVLQAVTVRPDDKVVDAVDLQPKFLSEGVRLAQLDGSVITYTGNAPARTVQVSATFRLKAGVLWSDNQQVDAADSRFSFEAASYFDTKASQFVTDRTLAYEVVDTFTVRWTGLPGWRDRDFARRFWSPLPRHLFDGVSPSELNGNAEANERPIGWGPFVIQAWEKGERLTMARNPNYFRAAEGLPRVDRVVFRFGLSPEQIIEEVKARRCDIGSDEAGFTALAAQLRAGEAAGLLAPQFVPDLSFEHLDFGIQPAEGYERVAGTEVFQDGRVRQGLAHCIDRAALINQLLSGVGEAPASYVQPNHPLLARSGLVRYDFDPAKGQRLLSEAGWAPGGDGVRVRDGKRLSLEYVSGPEGSAFRTLLAQLLQGQLKACGVELRIKWYPPQVLVEVWPGGPLFGRRFDLASFPWRAGSEPPCELYLSTDIPNDSVIGGVNNTGFANPEFDAACLRARQSFDAAESRAAHAEAQAIFSRDLPSLPLFFRFRAGLARPEVSGYQLDTTARSDLWNIEQIGVSGP